MPSSPIDPAAAQLHSEAASSQEGPRNGATPRRPPQASSPMNYRSSVEPDQNMHDVSSPLRQMSNTQTTQSDGDRTPRASGQLLGGE